MNKLGKDVSELTAAAEALDSELRAFEKFAEGLIQAPLNSQKAIERVGKMLQSVAEMDQRLSTEVSRLVSAIGKAREQQEKQAQAIQQRAGEIQTRVTRLQDLMESYAGLGRSAADLNERMKEVAAARVGENEDAPAKLKAVLDQMGAWADEAKALVERADREEFPDVGRLADSLRQQLLAARNRAQQLVH